MATITFEEILEEQKLHVARVGSNELFSKDESGRLEKRSESKKPEVVASGYSTDCLGNTERPSKTLVTKAKTGSNTAPILAESPYFYKEYGTAMSCAPFVKLPRSLLQDPRYRGARLKYQKVLLTILEYAAFAPTTHAIKHEIVPISVGQFCVTIRGLTDLCNQEVKHEEDKVDRSLVARAIVFFEKCQFVRQEVRQGKTLLTVTIPEFYKQEKNTSETTSETNARQGRDNKEEEREEREEKDHPPTPSRKKSRAKGDDRGLIDDFFSKKEDLIHVHLDCHMTQADLDECLKKRGSIENIHTIIHELTYWDGRMYEIKNWKDSILKWRGKSKTVARSINNEDKAKQIVQEYANNDPRYMGWSVRIYRDTKKDQIGLLFECGGSGSSQPVFISYVDPNFDARVQQTLIEKHMSKRAQG